MVAKNKNHVFVNSAKNKKHACLTEKKSLRSILFRVSLQPKKKKSYLYILCDLFIR